MRYVQVPKILFALAFLTAATGYANADNAAPGEQTALKLPGRIMQGVVRGDHLYAVTTSGILVDVDLKQRQVRDFSSLDTKLVPFVDVADGKACVASTSRIYVVDLANGTARSLEHHTRVRDLGFVTGGRVFAHNGQSMVVFDLASGKTLHAIDLSREEKLVEGNADACLKSGQRLCLKLCDGVLSAVDLDRGKVLDQFDTGSYDRGTVHVLGDKACVLSCSGSWAPIYRLHQIDLKTHKDTTLKLPEVDQFTRLTLVGASDGFFVGGNAVVSQYDAEGKMIGTTPLKEPGALLGVWNGHALVAGPESLQFVPLSRPTAKAN